MTGKPYFKSFLGLALAVLVAGSAVATPRGEIRIRGSDTMLYLVRRWAEGFMATHPGVVVEVEGGGTAKGVRALIAGQVDVASASRPMESDEARQLFEQRGTLGYAVLTARDALTLYLHPENPVRNLTREQLRGIFTGEIRRWSEVGGRDAAIVVLNRNSASGTHAFFAEHVLGGAEYTRRARVMPTTRAIVEEVAGNVDAIGYGGFGYVDAVFPCPVEGVPPSAENVRDGTYPIARYLYLYTAVPPEGVVKELVDWVLGDEGQRLVAEVGYIPLREPSSGLQ